MRRPAFVLFSGGVDSSLLLAAATSLARRNGWPEPVAITYRYATHGAAKDEPFQEIVARHIGLENWIVIERENAEVIGPEVARVIETVGLTTLPTLHAHLTAIDTVAKQRSGVLITGEGGDETLGQQLAAVPAILRRSLRHNPRRPWRTARHARHIASVAAASWRPPDRTRMPWLTDDGYELAKARGLLGKPMPPLSRLATIDRRQRRGDVVEGIATMDKLAGASGVEFAHPLMDDEFVTSLVRFLPRSAFSSRAALVERLWPDLLPPQVLQRRDKASFADAYFGDACRAFARQWDGRSLDSPYIDNTILRETWLGNAPMPTAHLLQAAWAAEVGLLQ